MDGDDDELKEIYNKLYNLNEFVDPEKFKTYEDLQVRLDKVLGMVSSQTQNKKVDPELQEEMDEDYQEVSSKKSSNTISKVDDEEDDDEDNALDYFQKLSQM